MGYRGVNAYHKVQALTQSSGIREVVKLVSTVVDIRLQFPLKDLKLIVGKFLL
jgi:hypothetical protein